MNNKWIFLVAACAIAISMILFACATQDESPAPEGPYLGQKPPGMTAEIFAPDIVSTEHGEFCSVFSPDGDEFYWSLSGSPYPAIVEMHQNNGRWTEPEIASFSGKYPDLDMSFTPDGKQLFYCSRRPLDGNGPPTDNTDFWFVERDGNGWSEPRHLEGPVNSEVQEYYPIFAQNGTLYFCSMRPGGFGGGDIYSARFENGTCRRSHIQRPFREWSLPGARKPRGTHQY